MFLLVAFMLMDNMLKFLSVIYLELIFVIFPLNLKMYYFKNIVVFSMDHPCGL